jgi:hypothetical protein
LLDDRFTSGKALTMFKLIAAAAMVAALSYGVGKTAFARCDGSCCAGCCAGVPAPPVAASASGIRHYTYAQKQVPSGRPSNQPTTSDDGSFGSLDGESGED